MLTWGIAGRERGPEKIVLELFVKYNVELLLLLSLSYCSCISFYICFLKLNQSGHFSPGICFKCDVLLDRALPLRRKQLLKSKNGVDSFLL